MAKQDVDKVIEMSNMSEKELFTQLGKAAFVEEIRSALNAESTSEQAERLVEVIKKWDATKSVMQDWVMRLPLRHQGVILTGIRGCDLAPKKPLCTDRDDQSCSTGEQTSERQLSAFLRYCTLNPADQREVDIPGAWFQSNPPKNWKPSELMHYPLHWYSHLMHCFEIVGYKHPDRRIAGIAFTIYHRLVNSLHLDIEGEIAMDNRLTEDRIASGEVVS